MRVSKVNLVKVQFPLTLHGGALRTAMLWFQQLDINKRLTTLGIKHTEGMHHERNRTAYDCALMEAVRGV